MGRSCRPRRGASGGGRPPRFSSPQGRTGPPQGCPKLPTSGLPVSGLAGPCPEVPTVLTLRCGRLLPGAQAALPGLLGGPLVLRPTPTPASWNSGRGRDWKPVTAEGDRAAGHAGPRHPRAGPSSQRACRGAVLTCLLRGAGEACALREARGALSLGPQTPRPVPGGVPLRLPHAVGFRGRPSWDPKPAQYPGWASR